MSSAPNGLAVVVGASGGIGSALVRAMQHSGLYAQVLGLSRRSVPALDLCDESSIAACAQHIQTLQAQAQQELQTLPLRCVVDATGILHMDTIQPEKSWLQLDAAAMAQAFAVNAIGPALLMKHFLPLLARDSTAVFATLSAKVGSIGDNRLGGWYSYRASKAALNQLVRTASIELRRRHPLGVCVALHPGTVATGLSAPFAKSGLEVRTPQECAQRLLQVMGGLSAEHSGGFFNHDGAALPW